MEGTELPNVVLSEIQLSDPRFSPLMWDVSPYLITLRTQSLETVSPETFSDIKFHKFQLRRAKLPPGPLRSFMSR